MKAKHAGLFLSLFMLMNFQASAVNQIQQQPEGFSMTTTQVEKLEEKKGFFYEAKKKASRLFNAFLTTSILTVISAVIFAITANSIDIYDGLVLLGFIISFISMIVFGLLSLIFGLILLYRQIKEKGKKEYQQSQQLN